jgi:Excalibur calcium-binding domain
MRTRSMLPVVLAALAGVLLMTPPPPQATAVDFDCGDFRDQATAQEYLRSGDPYFLDVDGDGIACEGLPCPCAKKSAEPGKSSSPRHLAKVDARRAANKLAWEVARSSEDGTTAGFGGCQRRAPHRIDCLAITRRKKGTTRTVCNLRIVVRATTGNPHAGLLSSKCHTRNFLIWTEAAALVALNAEMAEIVGQPVQVTGIERASGVSFRARAEWTRPAATAAARNCSALLMAELIAPPDMVMVSILFTDCRPAATM